MKYLLALSFFLFAGIPSLWAQLVYPEVIEARQPLTGPVMEQNHRLPFPEQLNYTRQRQDELIENPAIRYSIQNLKKEYYGDPEVRKALRTLFRYAEDEQMKNILTYLQQYTKRTAQKERALVTLQNRVTADSLAFHEETFEIDSNGYVHTDLQTFLNYVRNDSNYIWLRKISRDSVLLEISNIGGNSVRFWVNNGRNEYHRFWAYTNSGDTIGSWIQVFPHGNNIRLYLDEDVYQASRIEKKEAGHECSISNPLLKDYFTLNAMQVPELHRRYWTYYSDVELAMSQGKLTNWASGGENSLSLLSNLRYFWNYNRNKTSWESWVHYRFGFMKNGEEDLRKNEDRFELNTKVGQRAFKHWYYTAQFNMQTQLFNSYDYPTDQPRKLVANFMSPGYFTLSLGLDFKPHDRFSLMISPIAGKWNFVRDTAKIDPKRYGVQEEGKRYFRQAGAELYLKSNVNDILKLVNMQNELRLFMSYEEKDRYIKKGTDEEERKKFPVLVNWKLRLDFRINYFMNASINTELVYDENYARKIQFKENLNLGVRFRF